MPGPDSPLPPHEEEVRRLLAAARHSGSTPPDVVARLDRVLDGLAEEPTREASVVGLAARRRRVASVLVAAAAVVAVGIGVSQVVPTDDGDDAGESATSAESRDDAGAGDRAESPETFAEEDDRSAQAPATGQAAEPGSLATLPPERFLNGVAAARDDLGAAKRGELGAGGPDAADATVVACRAASWGRGTFVPVTYDSTPAVLVFRRPRGDTQVADLYFCGSEDPVRSVTLPLP